MQRLTEGSNRLSREAWNSLSVLTRREFYDGDLEALGTEGMGYELEKSMSYPISVTHVTSRGSHSYRRSWQHIRRNNVGFRLIWFVARGSLKIVRSHGTTVVDPGMAAFLNTNAPFQAVSICDEEGRFESYQAMVPADLFLAHLQAADQFLATFSLDTAEGTIVRRLLDVIIEQGENISRAAAKPLAESLLEAIAQCLDPNELEMPQREKLVDKRFADIENYILMNVTDPELSYDKVAANCGISPRYLCYLLKAHDTSFSDLLWKNRLPKAREWLTSSSTRHYPIHEISFMSGFKSAAHFSRMFKAAYGCPPSEFRALHSEAEPVGCIAGADMELIDQAA